MEGFKNSPFIHQDYVNNTPEQVRVYFLKGSLNIYLKKEATHLEDSKGPLRSSQ